MEPTAASLIRERFRLALVLIALAMLQADATKEREETESNREDGIEQDILNVTRAIAPVILPMISALASLDEEEVPGDRMAGAEV
jgi:hypothetical protein